MAYPLSKVVFGDPSTLHRTSLAPRLLFSGVVLVPFWVLLWAVLACGKPATKIPRSLKRLYLESHCTVTSTTDIQIDRYSRLQVNRSKT